MLFYNPVDGNWWLGSFGGGQLSWTLVGNTTGFGNISKNPFYVGDFTGNGQSSMLFYSPGDFNWWLGTFAGNQLNWNLAGNTQGFGQVKGLPFWVGRFSTAKQDQIMFYYHGDGNWWLGNFAGNQLSWTLVGNTTGFGNISKNPFYVGDFTGSGQSSMLFYSPGDFNWWLGTFVGNQLNWNLAGNTQGFGQVNDGRPFWVGHFSAPIPGQHPVLLSKRWQLVAREFCCEATIVGTGRKYGNHGQLFGGCAIRGRSISYPSGRSSARNYRE